MDNDGKGDSMMPVLERNFETLGEASAWKQELLGSLRPPGIHAASGFTFRDAVRSGLIGGASNIIGIGYGIRIVAGNKRCDEKAIIVYVRRKHPNRHLSERERIPSMINGQATDVVAVGSIDSGAGAGSPRKRTARDTLKEVEGGVSGAHSNVSLGTIGCVVHVAGSDSDYLLSCNHVFADENNAVVGDSILQAARGDRGNLAVATLTSYEPLGFSANDVNRIDAAIARVHSARIVHPTVREIGRVGPPMSVSASQAVKKHGRTSDLTTGCVVDISADIAVDYGPRRAFFEDQLTIQGDASNIRDKNPRGNFGQGGDSGSLVVDSTHRAVGLLFAVAEPSNLAYANPIERVLKRFGASIV